MEMVEGETLAARLKKGALSIDLALRYGVQIADALAAAHAKGIIHRDLKPGNIMLAKNGVKVLDFGLAKSVADRTLTTSRAVMGTPAYMAPEQYEAKECDARTDVFALGLVLYKMAKGKRAPQDQQPPMDGLPTQFAHVVERCLAIDPVSRWQSALDLKAELEWAAKGQLQTKAPQQRKWPWRIASAAAVLLAAMLGALFVNFREKTPTPQAVRFEITPPEGGRFTYPFVFVLSPDGRRLAFKAAGRDGVSRVWVRSLDSTESRPLAGTENAGAPFWAPDSRFLAFNPGTGKLLKIDASGGPIQAICDQPKNAEGSRGGAWGKDGAIIFGTTGTGLFRCSVSGGLSTPLTTLDPSRQEIFHGRPIFLPDGRHFLYVRYSRAPELTGVYAGSLDTKPEEQERRLLIAGQFGAAYAPSGNQTSGHLLFLRGNTLVAQPFDARRLELVGEPVPVAEEVGNNGTIFGSFTASDNGILVYRSAMGTAKSQLAWFDRQGRELQTVSGAFALQRNPAIGLSPDDSRAIVPVSSGANPDLWIADLNRNTFSRFTFDGSSSGLWSPDGRRVLWAAHDGSRYVRSADGSGKDELLFKNPTCSTCYPNDWSSDGKRIAFFEQTPETQLDIWLVETEGGRKPYPYLQTRFSEYWARFSPDGRWIAYESDQPGQGEIIVESIPAGRGRWQISTEGGDWPEWRRDGKELFFRQGTKIMAAPIRLTETAVESGKPQELFQVSGGTRFQVSRDGQRFLIAVPAEGGAASAEPPLTVDTDWRAGVAK